MNLSSLQIELREYLSNPENLIIKLDAGELMSVRLHALDQVPLTMFDVNSSELFMNRPLKNDPEETREYQGFDLVADCEDYQPEGIMIWFPEWQRFGSWDCDHHTIMTFPHAQWADIVKAPTWYFNGQWYPDKIEHEEVNPWTEQ